MGMVQAECPKEVQCQPLIGQYWWYSPLIGQYFHYCLLIGQKCPEEARGALVPLNYQEYFGENLVKLSCFE